MKYYLLIVFLYGIFNYTIGAAETELDMARKFFSNASKLHSFTVSDPISVDPVNTKIFEVFANTKRLGFYRKIVTTTGCDSACLPLRYTAIYDEKGRFVKIVSKTGLTKKNHVQFTPEDYARMNFLLTLAPDELNGIKNPKDMTDALSGETLKLYRPVVVKEAAYSTLRLHLYNQLTTKQIASKLQ